jgi:hypothetical protein
MSFSLPNFSRPAGYDRLASLSVQSRWLAGAFSRLAQLGIVPKTKKVREPRIFGGHRATEKKKNDI